MLATRFAALQASGRRALVCYVTAGHPDRERSIALVQGVADAGADVIELGVPFSDPVADGPVIQASSQRALDGGMTLDGTLEIASAAKVDLPLVLFTYLNPLLSAGTDVLERARAAGFSGLLTTDLPVGEDPAREKWIGEGPLDFVRLVAPTTPTERMAEIARHGRGFVYLISRLGVTGARADVPADLPGTVARLRSVCPLPICVGFGVSTGAQARAVASLADGVVVGSALVSAAERSIDEAVGFVRSLRSALDDAPPPAS
jgi:tryptophan synthase alpha chain